jgi:hypothetical protein
MIKSNLNTRTWSEEMMKVMRKTYKIIVEVKEPMPDNLYYSGSVAGSSPYTHSIGVTGPLTDQFWDSPDLKFQKAIKADEIVDNVRNILSKDPMFSRDNITVKLERFGYE